MAWRFATWPTTRSPDLVNPTTDGVVRPPSSLAITTGWPPSITATTEFVVPRSIPITLPGSAIEWVPRFPWGHGVKMAANFDALVGVSTETPRRQEAFLGSTGRTRPRDVIQRTSCDPDLCEMHCGGSGPPRRAGEDRFPASCRATGTVEFASGSKSDEGPGTDLPIPPCVSET